MRAAVNANTTTTLVPTSAVDAAAIVAWGMTRDQLDLIKRTVADGTTDDEFALYMTTAHRLGLDPFAKQIYAVKRSSWDTRLNKYVDKMAIQVGIDGFRAVADRTGENDGQDGPYWCGADGVWRDAWLDDAPPAAAKVVVYRKGCARPFTGIATFRSYVQTTRDGKPVRQWQQMPDVMLAKCAEALALRKAFPAQLSGVYAPEEMGQASNDNVREQTQPRAALPPPGGPAVVPEAQEQADEELLRLIAEDVGNTATADECRMLAAKIKAATKSGSPIRARARAIYDAQMAKFGDAQKGAAA